jgi:hypothetical protein
MCIGSEGAECFAPDEMTFMALSAQNYEASFGGLRLAMKNPLRYFNSAHEVIRIVVTMYVKYLFCVQNVEDILTERGIDICQETVRLWCNRFGPMFAATLSAQICELRSDQVKLGMKNRFAISTARPRSSASL